MMKNKRGQGISMNMIIIIILAILVLLVISIIFLGGAGTLNQKLRNIFGGNVGAYDMDLALANCQSYCDSAKNLPTNSQDDSAFCVHKFKEIDRDGDGQATATNEKDQTCTSLGFRCEGITTCPKII
ncbi:MAG: hypothetical protein ABH849_04965 [Nanoarchaeota archaeon]